MEKDENIWETLIRDSKKGKTSAITRLYEMTCNQMYGIALRMLDDRQAAEDVLQESYLIAFGKIGQLHVAGSFGAWLKRIVITHCLRFIKSKIEILELPDQLVDSSYTDGEKWWEDISIEVIHKAVQALPDGCRIVFNLYVIEELTHHEIAAMLDISESTSKTQYRRAKLLLKTNLQKKAMI